MSSKIFSGNLQKTTRIWSFLINSFIFIYFAIEDHDLEYFVYLTNWGLFLTSFYFLCAVLSYYFIEEVVLRNLFLVIWAFNWLITLVYWGYLYPTEGSSGLFRSSLTHSVPLMVTLIEYLQSQVVFERGHYIFPMSGLLAYLLLVLVPYTLTFRPIYAGIDFRGMFSVIFCLCMFIVTLIALELVIIHKDIKIKHILIDS